MLSESSWFHKLGVLSAPTTWTPEGGSHIGHSSLPFHTCLSIPRGLYTEGPSWSLPSGLAISLIWGVRRFSMISMHATILEEAYWLGFEASSWSDPGTVFWAGYHSNSAMFPSYLSGEAGLLLGPVLMTSPWTCEEGANSVTDSGAALEGCVPWEMMQGAHSLPGFGSFVTFRAQSHLIAADN